MTPDRPTGPAIGSPRDYIETDVLRIVSSYGGEVIVAGQRMQAMQSELADLVEQAGILDVERLARALPESWEPFWTETGNEDARDGFKEVTFDRYAFAQAVAAAYLHEPSREPGEEG